MLRELHFQSKSENASKNAPNHQGEVQGEVVSKSVGVLSDDLLVEYKFQMREKETVAAHENIMHVEDEENEKEDEYDETDELYDYYYGIDYDDEEEGLADLLKDLGPD